MRPASRDGLAPPLLCSVKLCKSHHVGMPAPRQSICNAPVVAGSGCCELSTLTVEGVLLFAGDEDQSDHRVTPRDAGKSGREFID